jgi:hypothetical protein
MRTSFFSRLPLALLLLIVLGAPLTAQRASPVEGRLVDARLGTPVAGAYVMLPSLRRGAISDSLGYFRLDDISHGTHRLRIERLGYMTLEQPVQVSAAAEMPTYRLEPAPAELEGVVASAPPRPLSPRMQGFELRRRLNQSSGRFLGRAELERHAQRPLPEVLRGFPGARITPATAAAHLSSNRSQPPDALRRPPTPCYAQIFMDGVRIYGQNGSASEPLPPPDLNALFVRELEAVEYYASAASTPIEFRTDTAQCGTLVLWTRGR